MDAQVPFESYARARPLRTYSHKTRNASSTVLPLLRTRELPASLGTRKHQRNPKPQDNGVLPEEETVGYQDEYGFDDAYELEFGMSSDI